MSAAARIAPTIRAERRRLALALLVAGALGGGLGAAPPAAGAPRSDPPAPQATDRARCLSGNLASLTALAVACNGLDAPTLFPLRSPNAPASPRNVARAARYAEGRTGRVSFAVIDRRGRLQGRDLDRRYASASLVKPLLLVAYLDRVARGEERLTPARRRALDRMIRVSDNEDATAIFAALGARAVRDLARRAGMRGFSVGASWGTARLTAADIARFFAAWERLTPAPHRPFARDLLSGIARSARWGIPRAAGDRWRVLFKGGWRETPRGELVNQAGRLERSGERISIAILTEGNPSMPYGTTTVRGVARRLISER